MRRRLPRLALVIALATALVSSLGHSRVVAQQLASIDSDLADLEAEIGQLGHAPLRRSQLRSATYLEERLTDGELFYRLGDHLRASIIFTDLVENHADHSSYPDALYLLADSLFQAGDYLGARRRFRQVLDHADEPAFQRYTQRTLGRLIEIAIHIRDYDGVEGYFARLSQLPRGEVGAETQYFRAKYLFSKAVPDGSSAGQVSAGHAASGHLSATSEAEEAADMPRAVDQQILEQARVAFESVSHDSAYHAQARYFVGVIHTLRAQYAQAIQAFDQVLKAPIETPEQQRVSDLAQLAIGRLHYETNQLDRAAEAYQAISRTSPSFDVALYEIAWTYIRQGDSTRAERALEVMGLATPDSHFIPDGKLLRGNLLLREGRFEDANEVFGDVAKQFGPVREELDALIAKHEDPVAYFRKLVRDNMEVFDVHAFMPESALRWTDVESEMDRALEVLSDLARARSLVRDTSQLVQRMDAALGAPNVVNVFADLRLQQERVVALSNRLARVRQRLIEAESRTVGGSGELAEVRNRRRQIEQLMGGMPTSGEDFRVRNEKVVDRYRGLDRHLSELEVALTGMEARIVASRRFLKDTEEEAQRDPEGTQALLRELDNHKGAVEGYRERITDLRMQSEAGRLQVGVGDESYSKDDALREEYEQLVARERELIAAAGVDTSRTDGLFRRAGAAQSKLDERHRTIASVVEERKAEMLGVLEEEVGNLEGYRARLAALEDDTEHVVGAVTYANFGRVRQRFYDLVLRADVGTVDVAWAEREEHRMRSEMLSRERARDLKALDDEFREIMDEGQGGDT